jgi:error-prone DNA polymerase
MSPSELPNYAELHCLSNFTFLRGASHPEELVEEAHALGYATLALTDECSLCGVVRAHTATKACGLKLVIGTEVTLVDGPRLVFLASDREGYGKLSALITQARRWATKGSYRLERADLGAGLDHCLALLIPPPERPVDDLPRLEAEVAWLRPLFPDRLWIAVELLRDGDDDKRLEALSTLGRDTAVPLVAAGDVHMHVRERQALQDTLTAIRLKTTVATAGYALYPNGERYLRHREILRGLYPPHLLAETLRIAGRSSAQTDRGGHATTLA